MKYTILEQPAATRLLDLPRVQVELDAEELTLLAVLVYYHLSGRHPARDSLGSIYKMFTALTGLTVSQITGMSPSKAQDILTAVEKKLGN